jgi:hypothetical protein
LLKVNSVDPGFSYGEAPHDFKPVSDRLFGTAHGSTGPQSRLILTFGVIIQIPCIEPKFAMLATIAHDAMGPFLLEQIIVTGLGA